MANPKGRPKKPSGEGTPVRLDPGLVAKARYIAAAKKIPISDMLSEVIRPFVDREFKKLGKELLGGDSPDR